MKRCTLFLFAAALLFSVPAQGRTMQEMANQVTNPIVIPDGESGRMSVTFNHSSHKAVSCMTCHHTKDEAGETRYVACRTCHNQPGAKNRHYMSTFMAFHAKDSVSSCYGCHSKKRAEQPEKYAAKFSGCYPCHASATAANK